MEIVKQRKDLLRQCLKADRALNAVGVGLKGSRDENARNKKSDDNEGL